MKFNKETMQLEGKVEIPNLRVMHIMNQAIARSNKPLNKYNTAMHMDTEALTGEPSDRTAYDVGTEMELKHKHD